MSLNFGHYKMIRALFDTFLHSTSRRNRRECDRQVDAHAHLAFEVMEERLMLYNLSGRAWSDTDISVSFLPDGTETEGYQSNLFATLDPVTPTETWQREFARALQTWGNAADLNFHFVSDDGSPTGTSGMAQGDSRFGDIRLGAHPLDSFVAFAYYPSSTTKGGDITLNPNYTFHIGTYIDLYSVLLHEAGHSLGLGHSTSGTIMYKTITGVYTGLTSDDIDGIEAIYGARTEDSFDLAASNDNLDLASILSLKKGTDNFRADLTSLADVDYYQVTVPDGTNGTLSVSLDARGVSFLAPKLSVFDSMGVLVTGFDAGQDYGSVATVDLTGLLAGESYYLAADGATDDEFGMGAYFLDIQFGGNPEPPLPDPPPTVTAVVRSGGADRFDILTSLAFTFSEDVSASLDKLDLTLLNTSTATLVDLTPSSVAWDSGTNTAIWDLTGATIDTGFHTATLLAVGISDASGNQLDGNGDMTDGDDFVEAFLVALPGDTDLDADIDSTDIQNILEANSFNNPAGGPYTWFQGDFDDDEDVDSADIQAVLATKQFGMGTYAATNVSSIEPVEFSALGVGTILDNSRGTIALGDETAKRHDHPSQSPVGHPGYELLADSVYRFWPSGDAVGLLFGDWVEEPRMAGLQQESIDAPFRDGSAADEVSLFRVLDKLAVQRNERSDTSTPIATSRAASEVEDSIAAATLLAVTLDADARLEVLDKQFARTFGAS